MLSTRAEERSPHSNVKNGVNRVHSTSHPTRGRHAPGHATPIQLEASIVGVLCANHLLVGGASTDVIESGGRNRDQSRGRHKEEASTYETAVLDADVIVSFIGLNLSGNSSTALRYAAPPVVLV